MMRRFIRAAVEYSALWQALGPLRRGASGMVAALEWLTRPVDRAVRDRETAATLGASGAARALMAAGGIIGQAWNESFVRHRWVAALGAIQGITAVERIRTGAIAVIVAAFVALTLRLLAPRPAPLTWIVPAGSGCIAAFVLAAARRVGNAPGREIPRRDGEDIAR